MKPAKGKNGLHWLIALSCEVEGKKEAEEVNTFMSGAFDVWQAGQQGSRASLTDTSGFQLLRIMFVVNGKKIEAFTEIEKINFVVRGSNSTLSYVFKVHGLLPLPAALLAENLGDAVRVKLETVSPLKNKASIEIKIPENENSGLLVNWSEDGIDQSGFVLSDNGSELTLITMKDQKKKVKKSSVVNVLNVRSVSETFIEFVEDIFDQGCSIVDLVDGIGAAFAAGYTKADDQRNWLLNDQVKAASVAVMGSKQ